MAALLFGWLLVLPSRLFAIPPPLHGGVAEILEEEKLTGAVLATVNDGAIAVDAAGVKDARSGRALGADDRVHVGSIAKTLPATGVLRLVSERRLSFVGVKAERSS